MALFTSHIDMRAIQREVAQVVVEGGVFPIARIVAGPAICPEPAAMLVILAVAGVTIHRRAPIHAILMTRFASCCGVRAFQFEGRKIVVESGWLPAVGRVTGSAIRTKARLVGVIRAMAGVTILRRRLEIRQVARIDMALHTDNFLVLPGQPE